MISSTTLENIRKEPIENVLNNFMTLKPAGVNFKGCCPLHDEKTPSFVVYTAKNTYKCFGCGAYGDAIQFVMEHENLPFEEACIAIAKDMGIPIELKEVKGKTEEELHEEERMRKMLHDAHVLFRKSIDKKTTNYLRDRGFTDDTIIEWQIGSCNDWRVYTPIAINEGYSLAEKCGLIRSKRLENGEVNTYDYFHHRLTIPIHDRRGQVVGFGGRKMEGEGPKYMNSPDTEVYNKSSILFGLHKAIKGFKKHGMAVLVEGYLDVIKMHQRGWDNAVATCGTALTEQQAKSLYRSTDTVLILRDGDKAGLNALKRDIGILVKQQFTVYCTVLPAGEDPDTIFSGTWENIVRVLSSTQDAIEYYCDLLFAEGKTSTSAMAWAIENVAELLSDISSTVRVEQYVKVLSKKYGLKVPELAKPVDKAMKVKAQRRADDEAAAAAAASGDEPSSLPSWCDHHRLREDGFVQLRTASGNFKPGIYFPDNSSHNLIRVTNFTLVPLYHIYEQTNNRRLVEVFNCIRTSVVEMPDECFVNQSSFEKELVRKGNFRTELPFTKIHFKMVTGWLLNSMPLAYELKTLGWQPEGFFAFSDRVHHKGQLLEYDETGNIKIDDRVYLSLGKSKIHRDERLLDNPYENDLYLSFRASDKMDFQKWAALFCRAYGSHGPYGISFVILTLFKDIVTRVSKMPVLYPYGSKGSGKSAFAESIAYLFFSGKDGSHEMIKPFNLNPGQGTPYSFFSRIERFRNCPALFNEFDENIIEDWKFGTIKASYDGEGREIGDGESGKKRKTRIQKVLGSLIIIGQYLSIKDDGSVLSRSISRNFQLSRIENLSEADRKAYEELQHAEKELGLSNVIIELLALREKFLEQLPTKFLECRKRLTEDTRAAGYRIEERLLNNYSLFLSASKFLEGLMPLPYSYDEFYKEAKSMVINHNKLLKDNSAIQKFWKAVETLFDQGIIVEGLDIKIKTTNVVELKQDGDITKHEMPKFDSQVLFMRFSNVHAKYAKFHRERSGREAPNDDTLLTYMKDQPYFIGNTPREYFNDKRTSAFVFDYDKLKELGINLEKLSARSDAEPKQTPTDRQPERVEGPRPDIGKQDDLPF
jgi:DNA primase